MDIWKTALSKLISAGKVMATWQLKSGVTFFMFVPSPDVMGDETVTNESDVRFDEIVSLDILEHMQLGAISVSNNVERCRSVLCQAEGLVLSNIPGGIRVTTT